MSAPVRASVPFTLDGKSASAPEGELLVHAAARHGVFIPTLCHDDKLEPYGGCRMCVVGVEGSPRPLPACATRVTEGMAVSTLSNGTAANVPQLRKTLTEMLLSEHLNADPGGRPNELIDLAEESCQKCTPCRIGNRALHHVCEELEHGRAPMPRHQVDEWLETMAVTSICGLGQGAPIPVRSAFEHWPKLFEKMPA